VVLGPDPSPLAGFGFPDFLSLPTGSFVIVGFTDDSIIDGPGADFTVLENVGGELADVYGSTDGVGFTLIGTAAGTTSFDIGPFGFSGPVRFLGIVGLDLGGASPGFDLHLIEISRESVGPAIPEPTTLALCGLIGAGFVGYRLRRRNKAVVA
jgi:hypothetical protein